jgi:serine protease AprX
MSATFRKAVSVRRSPFLLRFGLTLTIVCLFGAATSDAAGKTGRHAKLDRKLNDRATRVGTSRVIVLMKPGWTADAEATRLGGRFGRRLGLINGQVLELSNRVLEKLADHPGVDRIVYDRPIGGEMNRVALTVGARDVQQKLGYTGAGIGVAVIDSGVAAWHDDLTHQGRSRLVQSSGGQRVVNFVDFVGGLATPYDDNGHGTHVSGIIAGNGYDTRGARAGIAPEAHLVSLRVLDRNSRGVISNVIAALDYAVANKARYNIRVINLSVGAAVTESYNTDPLTLAAKRAVDAGIVVVTAAGNLGQNPRGETQYGAITAPGNAPWVLTVGASSHQGTVDRADDVMAGYSSRGPSAIDFQAKPDVVAPGTGLVSLSSPGSYFYQNRPQFLVTGTLDLLATPYLSLSGTSMAAPVVAGTVALMLQANPNLTPNLVKAIVQYTAQWYPAYNALTEGAGFLNTRGAVELAAFFRTLKPGESYPVDRLWSRTIIWGNHRLRHGVIQPGGSAWDAKVMWGAAIDSEGDNIVWGTRADEGDNIVWGTLADEGDNIVWGTRSDEGDNIVWGTRSDEGDNIVWGTADDQDNVVWGTDCGGADCENAVWATSDGQDHVVWGTAADEGDNIVWGTSLVCESAECASFGVGADEGAGPAANIVWGTAPAVKTPRPPSGETSLAVRAVCDGGECRNIVWGTAPAQTTAPPPVAAEKRTTPAGTGSPLGRQ